MNKEKRNNFINKNNNLLHKVDFEESVEDGERLSLRTKVSFGSGALYELYTRNNSGFRYGVINVIYLETGVVAFDNGWWWKASESPKVSFLNIDKTKLSLFFNNKEKGERIILNQEIRTLFNSDSFRDGDMSRDILMGLIVSLLSENKYSVEGFPYSKLEKMLVKAQKRKLFRECSEEDFVALFLSYNARSLFGNLDINSIEDLNVLKHRILALR